MDLNLDDPLFATYAVAASLMILKAASMSWLTVARMMKVNAGFRSPEDAKKTPLNRSPRDGQVGPNEYVDRIRRIHLNDLENLPFFLVVGFLFVLTEPTLLVARLVLYGYVVSRLLHFYAYLSEQVHDLRAALWTPGSLLIIGMALRVLYVALAT